MNRQLEETLIEALDLLEQGQPVGNILAQYPQMADELRPFLLTAAGLTTLAQPSSSAAQQASKQAFLEYAAGLQESPRQPTMTRLRRVLVSGLAFVLLFLLAGSLLLTLSANALPGDSLYGAKLFLESVRLNYSSDAEDAAAILESYRQERLDEIERLLALGRSAEVMFNGRLDELTADQWIVDGLPVTITPATIIHSPVVTGLEVRIIGRTANGVLLATEVEVASGSLPQPDAPDPLPATPPSPSPQPSPTRTPMNTPEGPGILPPGDEPASQQPTPTPTTAVTPEVTPPNDDGAESGDDSAPGIIDDSSGSDDSTPGNEDDSAGSTDDHGGDTSGSSGDNESGDDQKEEQDDSGADPSSADEDSQDDEQKKDESQSAAENDSRDQEDGRHD